MPVPTDPAPYGFDTMALYEVIAIVILVLVFLCVPMVYRVITRPMGIGEERRRFMVAWLSAAQRYRKRDYAMIDSYSREMIVWFRPPIIEEFYDKARKMRVLLKARGEHPRRALEVWAGAFDHRPALAVTLTPEELIDLYLEKIEC